jgi:aminopeptidase C
MNKLFLQWAKEHTKELVERGIVSEIPDLTRGIVEKKLQNPCQVVYYYSDTHVGYVSVWRTGIMDMEILNFETEKLEYYRHFDEIKNLSFENILEEFFQNML